MALGTVEAEALLAQGHQAQIDSLIHGCLDRAVSIV